MKKYFRNLALAIAVMSLAAACNNNAPAEEAIDTMVPVVDSIVEEVIDSTPVEEVVVEEPVKKATPAKKKATAKKEEPKIGKNVTKEEGVTISTSGGSLKMGTKDGKLTGETTVTTNEGTTIHTNNVGGLKKKKN